MKDCWKKEGKKKEIQSILKYRIINFWPLKIHKNHRNWTKKKYWMKNLLNNKSFTKVKNFTIEDRKDLLASIKTLRSVRERMLLVLVFSCYGCLCFSAREFHHSINSNSITNTHKNSEHRFCQQRDNPFNKEEERSSKYWQKGTLFYFKPFVRSLREDVSATDMELGS